MMKKHLISNALLFLGAMILIGFILVEVTGMQSDPLLPAFAAFLIGCTAVLDRVGVQELDEQ